MYLVCRGLRVKAFLLPDPTSRQKPVTVSLLPDPTGTRYPLAVVPVVPKTFNYGIYSTFMKGVYALVRPSPTSKHKIA